MARVASYILTAHFGPQRTKWEGIQKDYIARNTTDYVLHVNHQGPTHDAAWDTLFKRVSQNWKDEDYLIWMDGDAFPVEKDWLPRVQALVDDHKLIAPLRGRKSLAMWPHPCFTATTVGLWRQIKGTWQHGRWPGPDMRKIHNDYGGRLAEQLSDADIQWLVLDRLDNHAYHHVLFALFGLERPLVYHHGAGYRPAVFAADGPDRQKFLQQNTVLSDEWRGRIKTDPDFWKDLLIEF